MKVLAPVKKNQNYQVKVEDLSYQGMGVAKIDDFPIFVNDVLPGEEAIISVTKVKKNFAFARMVKLITKSPDRVESVANVYTQTGIAPLQDLKYPAQLKFKQHQIESDFEKVHFQVEVAPTVGMTDPTHYRNKAQIPVREVKGQLETGFYRRHSHELVPIEDFYIQDREIDKAIVFVRDLLRKYKIVPYNEIQNSGTIRNVMVRRGHYSHQMMIVLITRTSDLPHSDEIIQDIHEGLPEVKSIVQNINPAKTNALMGRKSKLLFGKETIEDSLLNLKFAISANSFYQVNPTQTEKLYSLAIQKANLTKNDVVIDAYCGIGTISLAVADKVKKVFGVEIVPEAIEDAKLNAKLNGIKNVKFKTGKAEEQLAKWQADGLKPDVVFVDPPRKGLDESLINSVVKMDPKRVVYVSCNPATLVRDVQLFSNLGFHINQPIQPVDQFPQTVHIESITVLQK